MKTREELENLNNDDIRNEYLESIELLENKLKIFVPIFTETMSLKLYLQNVTLELFKRGMMTKKEKDNILSGSQNG